MVRSIVGAALTAVMAFGMAAAHGNELGSEIDLTAFGEPSPDAASVWDGVPLQEVSQRVTAAPRRFYASAMMGPSFAKSWVPGDPTLDSNDTLLAAGGALGISLERARGRLRLEVEGTGRSTFDAPMAGYPVDDTILTSNWSAMSNVWRDLMISKRFGIYGGGGLGAGGYVLKDRYDGTEIYNYGADSAFAWQFGGGLLWQITDRLTFDTGYRYFQIDVTNRPRAVPTVFGSSELMFTLRLYEPFRNWRGVGR